MIFLRRRYKFTDKHNTKMGITSFVLGSLALILLFAGLKIAFDKKGNADMVVGVLGTLVFIFSTVGLLLGLSSFKEEDRFLLFSWIGTITCGLVWLMIIGIIALGM